MVYSRGKNKNSVKDFGIKIDYCQYVEYLGKKIVTQTKVKCGLEKAEISILLGLCQERSGEIFQKFSTRDFVDCYIDWNEDIWFSEAFYSKAI